MEVIFKCCLKFGTADERIARKIQPIPYHFCVTFEWARQQNVTGAARAEQVEATSKSELSMSTLQKLLYVI
jgi:hypothetical protein